MYSCDKSTNKGKCKKAMQSYMSKDILYLQLSIKDSDSIILKGGESSQARMLVQTSVENVPEGNIASGKQGQQHMLARELNHKLEAVRTRVRIVKCTTTKAL